MRVSIQLPPCIWIFSISTGFWTALKVWMCLSPALAWSKACREACENGMKDMQWAGLCSLSVPRPGNPSLLWAPFWFVYNLSTAVSLEKIRCCYTWTSCIAAGLSLVPACLFFLSLAFPCCLGDGDLVTPRAYLLRTVLWWWKRLFFYFLHIFSVGSLKCLDAIVGALSALCLSCEDEGCTARFQRFESYQSCFYLFICIAKPYKDLFVPSWIRIAWKITWHVANNFFTRLRWHHV